MGIRVVHDLDDLVSDLRRIPSIAARDNAKIVAQVAREGNKIAKRFAREGAGPHGKDYHKRLSAEAIGPLSWEYGPEGIPKSDFVGVGFRHGINTDLPRSADIIGPEFARRVRAKMNDWFWPA